MNLSRLEPIEPRRLLAAAPMSFGGLTLVADGPHDIRLRVTLLTNRFTGKNGGDRIHGEYSYDRTASKKSKYLGLTLRVENDLGFVGNIGLGLTFTKKFGGTFTAHDKRGDPIRGTFKIRLTEGAQNVTGTVFNDLTGNGKRNGHEPGLSGATVWQDADDDGLYDRGEPRAFTDATGYFKLKGVENGFARTIRYVPRRGFVPTQPADAGQKLDVLAGYKPTPLLFGARSTTPQPTPLPGPTGPYVAYTKVTGRIFFDYDANGRFDGTVTERHGPDRDFEVFFDLNDDGYRNYDDPYVRPKEDNNGLTYALFGTVPRGTAVRLKFDEIVTTPRHGFVRVRSDRTLVVDFGYQIR